MKNTWSWVICEERGVVTVLQAESSNSIILALVKPFWFCRIAADGILVETWARGQRSYVRKECTETMEGAGSFVTTPLAETENYANLFGGLGGSTCNYLNISGLSPLPSSVRGRGLQKEERETPKPMKLNHLIKSCKHYWVWGEKPHPKQSRYLQAHLGSRVIPHPCKKREKKRY